MIAAMLLLGGCQTLGYYAQAIDGQMQIWRSRRSIERWVADEKTDPALRDRLEHVLEIRRFAVRELGLPDNGSYRGYADLHRQFVVWNVFAVPEFSLQPKRWCFPFAGCVAYRGYFAQADAQAFAEDLRGKGYDVFVGGVPAYSTLGWFDDPVLNTFIRYPEPEVARLLFHELAHQVAYAGGDTEFNESFATTVELEGMRRWLEMHGTQAQREAFDRAQARKRDFLALVQRCRDVLKALYGEEIPDARKREAKAAVFARMRDDYGALKESWGGFAGYDHWFEPPLNNAKIVSVAAYADLVPAFQRLLADERGDLPAFYAEVKRLARMSKEERRARLGSASPAIPSAPPV